MDRFRGSVALVTGASAGIGEGIARELCVVHGMKVVGCARRQDRLTELEKSFKELVRESGSGGEFFGVVCDLEKDDDIKNMFDWIRTHPQLGQLDVCINNAGIWAGEHLIEGQPDMWRRMWNLNVVASSLCTQHAINLMIEKDARDGHVMFVNSLAGHQLLIGGHMVIYNSTKLALTCVVDGWRREVQRVGENRIRISQICPGLVESEIMFANDPDKSDYSKNVFSTTPHLKPSHIAYAVVAQLAAPQECLLRDSIVTQVHETW